jgi:hypothetical protein
MGSLIYTWEREANWRRWEEREITNPTANCTRKEEPVTRR